MENLDGLVEFLNSCKTKRGAHIVYDIKGYHRYLDLNEAIDHFYKEN